MPATKAPARKRKLKHGTCYGKYGILEKAKALSVLDHFKGNAHAAAQHIGIPRKTLETFALQAQRDDEFGAQVRQLRLENRGELGPAAIDTAWEALWRMKELIPSAALRDATVAFGMAVERGLILNGQPTQIHASVMPSLEVLTVDQRLQLREWLRQGQERSVTVDAVSVSAEVPQITAVSDGQ